VRWEREGRGVAVAWGRGIVAHGGREGVRVRGEGLADE